MKVLVRSLFLMLAVAVSSPSAQSQTLGPDFANLYIVDNLGSAPVAVPGPYGGMVFKAGDPNTLLLVGAATGCAALL